MTTVTTMVRVCAVCGTESEMNVVVSTSAFGSPDLDTRPPAPMRHTIGLRVQQCPTCGYCAGNIEEAHPGTAERVATDAYRARLEDPAYPTLANRFRALAWLRGEEGRYAEAAWAAIQAAWMCDDHQVDEAAVACRREAAERIVRAQERAQPITQQQGAAPLLLVDLLRRAGDMALAHAVLEGHRETIPEGLLTQLVSFEEALLQAGDRGCYTVARALGEEDVGDG